MNIVVSIRSRGNFPHGSFILSWNEFHYCLFDERWFAFIHGIFIVSIYKWWCDILITVTVDTDKNNNYLSWNVPHCPLEVTNDKRNWILTSDSIAENHSDKWQLSKFWQMQLARSSGFCDILNTDIAYLGHNPDYDPNDVIQDILTLRLNYAFTNTFIE